MWIYIPFIIIGILLFFIIFQFISDRKYKLSIDEIIKTIEASIEGRMNLMRFDEFSCVRIAYDPRLDNIREKYNKIVMNPEYMEDDATEQNATPLNETGKKRLNELIDELRQLSA